RHQNPESFRPLNNCSLRCEALRESQVCLCHKMQNRSDSMLKFYARLARRRGRKNRESPNRPGRSRSRTNRDHPLTDINELCNKVDEGGRDASHTKVRPAQKKTLYDRGGRGLWP